LFLPLLLSTAIFGQISDRDIQEIASDIRSALCYFLLSRLAYLAVPAGEDHQDEEAVLYSASKGNLEEALMDEILRIKNRIRREVLREEIELQNSI
jgi:hypothetical protein